MMLAATTTGARVAQLVIALSKLRCDLSDEKRAQAQIAELLTGLRVEHAREVRLAPGDIIDFMVGEDIGLDVKLRGARKRHVFGQLERYAGHTRIAALVLASNLSMGLPAEIGGKPAFFVSLGKAWL